MVYEIQHSQYEDQFDDIIILPEEDDDEGVGVERKDEFGRKILQMTACAWGTVQHVVVVYYTRIAFSDLSAGVTECIPE